MNTNNPIKVIVQGLGPIGQRILAAAYTDPKIKVVGAVDIDESLVGKNTSSLSKGLPNLTIHSSIKDFFSEISDSTLQPEAVLQATGSKLDTVARQLEEALELKLHVISTCEELSYPYIRHRDLAKHLDNYANRFDASLIGTGVNPGFVMDQVVAAAAGASHTIHNVEVRRIQNPKSRRKSFRKKVGMDMTQSEYEELTKSNSFGHVGLLESGYLIAESLGWEITNWAEEIKPVYAKDHNTVLGTIQIAHGTSTNSSHFIHLHFEAHSGVESDTDEIAIHGTPPINLRFINGVFGDDATAAAILRAARVIRSAPAGLITVLDLPLRENTPYS